MEGKLGEIRFMKGNEALAEAAIRAGMEGYFGYPITPQSEVIEYLAAEEPNYNYVLLQAESEVASINMLYGGAAAGARVLTTTSSPGYSLMQEGVSYIACAELPCVIANIARGGPGLGTIQPGQGDYFQAVKGGGHGDYKLIVLAPNSVQEMVDHTMLAFELADKYRTPVLILSDGAIGQMMEKVELPDPVEYKPDKPWATTGKTADRERNYITSLYIKSDDMERKNIALQKKFKKIEENEIRYEEYMIEDAEIVITAYGVTSRTSKKIVDMARESGIKMGLHRPVTLWPFPFARINELANFDRVKAFLSIEMSVGQMVEDVRLAANGAKPTFFYGRTGGIIPAPEEVLEFIKEKIREL